MTSARPQVADDVSGATALCRQGAQAGVTSRAGGAVPRARPGSVSAVLRVS